MICMQSEVWDKSLKSSENRYLILGWSDDVLKECDNGAEDNIICDI